LPEYEQKQAAFNSVLNSTVCCETHAGGLSYKLYTDKKENQNFPIYKEIYNGAVAKSYITNGLLIYGEIFPHLIIYWEALPHI
jgi:hypothetical protein